MSKYYSDVIKVRPGYESVVKIESDKNDKKYWEGYIVNDDIVKAVRLITKSLKRSDPFNDTWHFIMQGTYGTGKTYSALVLKHLLEDKVEEIQPFLSNNPLFSDVKDKFLGIRKLGKYVVSWKSGEAKKLNTTDKLLLELERTVREALLREGYTYLGMESLIDSIKKKVQENNGTLRENFEDEAYGEFFSKYSSYDEFKARINVGDRTACDVAIEIFSQKAIHLATDMETFKAWIHDLFDGNAKLRDTGIFIIWDEFSEYIRGGNDLEILQELSQLSQEIPFYIMYVIHKYSADESIAGAGEMVWR